MNVAVFITARVASTRLPRKHVLKIENKYCIEYAIDRAKLVSQSDMVILCTTHLEEDNILVDIAKQNNIIYYRGSVHDKLKRWLNAAELFNVDFFVTVGGDNLFSEPYLLDLAINQYMSTKPDLISWENTGLICGSFGYGINVNALKKIVENKITEDTELEYDFFKKGEFYIEPLKNIPSIYKRNDIRATMDYPEDYNFFKETIKLAKSAGVNVNSLHDIIKLLDQHPEITKLNIFKHQEWKNNQEKKIKQIIY